MDLVLPILSAIGLLITGGLVGVVFKRLEKVGKIDVIDAQVSDLELDIRDLKGDIRDLTQTLQLFVTEVKVLITKMEAHGEIHEEWKTNYEAQRRGCSLVFETINKRLERLEEKK